MKLDELRAALRSETSAGDPKADEWTVHFLRRTVTGDGRMALRNGSELPPARRYGVELSELRRELRKEQSDSIGADDVLDLASALDFGPDALHRAGWPEGTEKIWSDGVGFPQLYTGRVFKRGVCLRHKELYVAVEPGAPLPRYPYAGAWALDRYLLGIGISVDWVDQIEKRTFAVGIDGARYVVQEGDALPGVLSFLSRRLP